MLGIWCQGRHLNVALRMESVGRNNLAGSSMPLKYMSLSAWRAWVEIKWLDRPIHTRRSLSAWRAWVEMLSTYPDIDKRSMSLSAWRAWVEMPLAQIPVSTYFWSLSAWRAWVEMIIFRMSLSSCPVALRMESVGRNTCKIYDLAKAKPSLSAWRAWVEIFSAAVYSNGEKRRSPHGERG